jgi:phage/plasmid primase-like uncharacterized protein
MAAAGLACADEIVPDGEWHHYRIAGQKKKNGGYQLHADPPANGRFKSYAGGPTHEWRPDGSSVVLSPPQRAAIERKTELRKKRNARRKSDAATRANTLWDAATPAADDHLYLARKRVASYGLRSIAVWEKKYKDEETGEWLTARLPDALLVPLRDAGGNIVSLQAIFGKEHDILAGGAGGDKDFLPGGPSIGVFHVVGELTGASTIGIAEGYATAASVHAATGYPIFVACTAANLTPVTAIVSEQHRGARVVVAADNDIKPGRSEGENTGVREGRKAADAAGAILAVPEWDGRKVDFNDIACEHPDGLVEVRRQIKAAIELAPVSRQISVPAIIDMPDFPLATLSGEEGRHILETTITAYFDALERAWEARDWGQRRAAELIDEAEDRLEALTEEGARKERTRLRSKATRETLKKFGRTDRRRLRLQIAGAAGIGKTRVIASEYRNRPALWKRHIEFYGMTIKNGQDVVEAINAEPRPAGMPMAQILRGRTYADEDTSPVCAKHEIVSEAIGKVPSLYKAFCNNGEVRCDLFRDCEFIQRRLDRSPRLRVFPHQTLASPQTADLRPPDADLAIVDESVVTIMVKEITVPIDKIADPEIYGGDAGDVADYVGLGETVVDFLTSGPNVPGRLNATDVDRQEKRRQALGTIKAMGSGDEAHIVARLRRAAKAADGGGTMADILPSDSADAARKKLALATGTVGWKVAALYRQLARDIVAGRDHSIGVQFIPSGTKGRDDKPTEADAVKVHGMHQPSFEGRTPLLLIDADCIPAVNDLIFGGTIPAIEIRCKREGHFTQASDFEGSTTTLLPKAQDKPGSARRAATAAKLRDDIVAFAVATAKDGKRVFVAAAKPVRVAITGEKPDSNLPVNFHDPRGFDISHIGKIIGRNDWSKHTVGIMVGREELPVQAAEAMVRGIYANAQLGPSEGLNFAGAYVRARRRRFPGSNEFVGFWAHPDSRIQALVELKRERAVVQNIDRLRLVYKDERDVRLYVLCSLPLPGIVPDVIETRANITAGGTRLEKAIGAGPVSSHPGFTTWRHEGIWPSEKAFETDLGRSKTQAENELENPQLTNRNILSVKWGFSNLRACSGMPVELEFRHRGGGKTRAPKWSCMFYIPRAPGHGRPDIQIATWLKVNDMNEIELGGDGVIAVAVECAQDEAGDRIAVLTKMLSDPEPTPDERKAFIEACEKFFAALGGHPAVPAPDWWKTARPAADLVSLVPLGRQFSVWYTTTAGRMRGWYFADADGGIFADQEFRRIEVPTLVREHMQRAEISAFHHPA